MTEQPPITPSDEQVQQWVNLLPQGSVKAFTAAAQWGADQELLACGNYLKQCAAWEEEDVTEFYNYRRPRPLSLKEQALALIDDCTDPEGDYLDDNALSIIRRALETLPE